jgi:hypothetical protein
MSASAIVNVTVRVTLSQPWGDTATVAEVLKQAKSEALNSVARLIKGHSHINLVTDPEVKVIYEEGR